MKAIELIRERARKVKKTVALPEYNDKRVIEGAKLAEREGVAKILFLTPDKMEKDRVEKYIEELFALRQAKGAKIEDIRKLFEDPLYYAAMLTRDGLVDGFVAGASHTTADVCRAALYCVGIDERLKVASSSFIMAFDGHPLVPDNALIYADCGLIPDPNARQLASIASSAAELGRKVLDIPPRGGMLSFSTKGSAQHKILEKIVEAVSIIKEMEPDLMVDGELQADAALVPGVGHIKCPDSKVAGQANILIFPDLNAGNICYKLTERLAGARALGPLLMGFKRPCSDLSRGCSAEDVMDCVAVTAIRA